ncbi:unnamed protein product [Dicrocoelium dendriticum]|nr:unnamed protein product [Dicrocoelium dendriticum]
MFDVTIKTLDGRDSLLTVDDEIKVEEFKSVIESKLDIPVAQQRLIFQGRVLPDNTRLIDCGVKDKVVHLVPRPPPVQDDGQSTPSSTGVTTSTSTFGQPLGGWDMRQTIQDITAGIFSGLGEFGRSIHIPGRANTDQSVVTASTPAAALISRERAFNRLYRQASHISRRISHTPLPPTIEASAESNSTCSEEGGSSVTVVNQTVAAEKSINGDVLPSDLERCADPISHVDGEPSAQLPLIDSPMAVDPESSCLSTPDAAESVTSGNHQTHPHLPDHPIAMIANMLCRQRHLWRSIEPYLDQWETMLTTESRSQQSLPSEHVACSEVLPSSVDIDQDDPETQTTQPPKSVSEPLPLDTVVVDPVRGSTQSEWHHRFFAQISRLLHLHAHMLHLISDFNVVSLAAPQRSANAPANVVSNGASDNTLHNATPEASHDVHLVMESENVSTSSRNDEPRPHHRRVVQLPETEGHWIRARINVEPVSSTVRPPPSNLSQQPVARATMRGRSTLPDSPDPRRSQSASNVDRSRNPPTGQILTGSGQAQRSDQAQGAPVVPTSVHSGSFVTGGTAIIHRVDIPIISMNMINLPVSALEHLSAPLTASARHTGSSAPAAATEDSSQRTTAGQQPSEPSSRITEGSTDTAVPTEQPPHMSTAGPTDPFLVCHSRHFAHEHHHRIMVPFVPHTTTQIIPASFHVPATRESVSGTTQSAPSVPVSVSPQQAVSTAEPETATTPSVADAAHTNAARTIQSSLTQQIASLITSATNAATAAAAGGFDLRPFNVFLSTPPIHVNSAAVIPNVPTAETDTNSGTTASGPWQSFSWMFGRDNPPPSAAPSNSSQPTPVQQDSNQTLHPVLTTPSWGRGTGDTQLLMLTGSNRILNVFIEALIETIWSRLSRLANSGGDCPSACFSVWSGSQSINTSNQEISVGLLTDMLTVARGMLSTNASDDVSPSSLDAMRVHLRHLINYADSLLTNKDRLAETIVELLFDGNTSDETLSAESSEAHAISWVKQRCEGGDDHLIDVRASLVRLFKANLSAQIELWRTSPTNFGFGSTLLWTIADFCVDCFCMVDLISSQLAKISGLQTATTAFDGLDHYNLSDPREFHTLIDRLNAFAETLSHSQTDAQFVRFVLAGVNRCIDRYSSMDQKAISRRWDRLSHACIVRRRLAAPSSMDVDDLQNQLCADDTDVEDLPFVDASSDLAGIDGQSVASGSTQPRDQANMNDISRLRRPSRNRLSVDSASGKVSPLPEWAQISTGSTENWIECLSRHPDTSHSLPLLSPQLSPEGWHAVLPSDWIDVVAADIETMNRSQSLNGAPDIRFSDAYIAGMPAKRRKVMQEHSRALAQPPKTFFADCLSDAIRSSGCDPSASSDENLQPDSKSNLTCDSTGRILSRSHSPVSEKDLQLVHCLRNLVSERIGDRLIADPDFDPVHFPISSKIFLKKQTPKD